MSAGAPRQHLPEQLPRPVHGEPIQAAQVVAAIAMARAAFDARIVGAMSVRFGIRKEHRRPVCLKEAPRQSAGVG